MPIDERGRRRPEFSEASVPIRLSDSQTWFFPKPWVETRGRFVGGKPAGIYSLTTHGPEFDRAVEELRAADTDHDIIVATMTIGAFLLRKQYGLSDDEMESLFVFRFDTEEQREMSRAMVKAIADVATGAAPSSFRDGFGSP